MLSLYKEEKGVSKHELWEYEESGVVEYWGKGYPG